MERKKNIYDKIGALIPGYSGYVERDSRRNCDKQLRDILSNKLSKNEHQIVKRISNAIMNSNKELMRELEFVRKEINTTLSKVKYAPYGASSFFADNQIKEDELMKIYQFDLEISEIVESLGLNINNYEAKQLLVFLEELNQLLENRNQYIKEHK